jgi:hypothetical protein
MQYLPVAHLPNRNLGQTGWITDEENNLREVPCSLGKRRRLRSRNMLTPRVALKELEPSEQD